MAMSQLSFTGKRWIMHSTLDASHTNIDELIAARLPKPSALLEPSVFSDMERAATRLRHALQTHERIGILGDYDCDGITASAQIIRYCHRNGNEPQVILPHRARDGYGLKSQHIRRFADANVSLLITVDTGITALAEVQEASKLGMDCIIIDHHSPVQRDGMSVFPDAYAIVHPARAPALQGPAPAAAGVAYAYIASLEGGSWEEQDTDLALAMMGTVADLVPLRGANRTLVQEGLHAFTRLSIGSSALAELARSLGPKTGRITATDIAFRIAPRINAAGRMDDPHIALSALLEGGQSLHRLTELNTMRQDATARAVTHAMRMMNEEPMAAFVSVMSSSYAPGIVGLIAGKITQQTGLPSMAAHIDGDVCTASLRSTEHYNIVDALSRHAHLLQHFGGHAQAAGATFSLCNADALCNALTSDAEQRIAPECRIPTLSIDAVIQPSWVRPSLCDRLETLQPFGQGNPEPLFLLPQSRLDNRRRVGGDGAHLQARVNGIAVIGFGLGHLCDRTAKPVDLACRVGRNEWNGHVSAQLLVEDMRAPKQSSASDRC